MTVDESLTLAESSRLEPFYKDVVENVADLRRAIEIVGLDQEIGLVRTKLLEHMRATPDDLDLMLKSVTLIVRAVAQRYRMSDATAKEIELGMLATLDELRRAVLPPEQEEI